MVRSSLRLKQIHLIHGLSISHSWSWSSYRQHAINLPWQHFIGFEADIGFTKLYCCCVLSKLIGCNLAPLYFDVLSSLLVVPRANAVQFQFSCNVLLLALPWNFRLITDSHSVHDKGLLLRIEVLLRLSFFEQGTTLPAMFFHRPWVICSQQMLTFVLLTVAILFQDDHLQAAAGKQKGLSGWTYIFIQIQAIVFV